MFNRIIVVTVLSPASFGLVNCLEGLKVFGAKQCLLLQCLSFQEAASTALSYSTARQENTLHEQQKVLEAQGFEVESRIVPGFAKLEINRVADEEEDSLIAVGTHAHSMVGDAMLGGVAYELIHSARKPILLIPQEKKCSEGDAGIQTTHRNFSEHILFPTDFSENADHAFTYVEKLAADGAQHITLAHVQDKSRIDPHLTYRLDEFNEIDHRRLAMLRERLPTRENLTVDISLSYGSPYEEITRLIRERNVHMVVMGSQGRSFVKEVLLGSVSHNVARHSIAPVLLIPLGC